MTGEKEAASFAVKAGSILAYSICSSTMLVVNKLAVKKFPMPTVVSGLQLLFTVLVVEIARRCGYVSIERMSMLKVKPFIWYTAAFAAGLYANIQSLNLTSVGAVIAAKSCLPICVCIVEWMTLGRQLPNGRSVIALIGVLLSAIVYVKNDTTLQVRRWSGMVWLSIWFSLLVFQMTYGKHIADELPMSQWEKVMYTNLFSLPWTLILFATSPEPGKMWSIDLSPQSTFWLCASCIVAVGISYTGWLVRDLVSASTYSLVGVLNKMATIALNAIAFPHDTGTVGIIALISCITIGVFYQDPPRAPRKSPSPQPQSLERTA